ncbi:MAG TPA: alpha/beta hydrolase [Planctomycetota bacterium]|nr:alpha/beta hydrolase [Planctomycetota bacterium]
MTENTKGPLLLIHGFPLDGRIWDPMIAKIKVRQLIVPDLRGCGKTPLPPGPSSIDDYARDLLAIMDASKVDRFAVAGHSMGGYIAFALLRLAPQRVSALALVSSRALPDSEEMKKTREATAQRAEKEGPGFLAGTMPERAVGSSPPPGVVDALRKIIREAQPKGVAAASRAMAARPDATPQLGQIQIPTLVFAGRGDKIVPASESEAMATAIPGSKLVWCEKSGHVPMLEEPELVASELSALMK